MQASKKEKVNILLVDDQPGKLASYEVILSELDENLLKASSAKEALEILLKTDVAVILVDVCMPELDGFELAQMIREHPRFKDTAIIFISAVLLSELDSLKAYEMGGVDYVSVPVVPGVLRAKVRVFVDLYRKSKELERINDELERRVKERTAELEAAIAQQELLAREVDHRARNSLAVIQSIVSMMPPTPGAVMGTRHRRPHPRHGARAHAAVSGALGRGGPLSPGERGARALPRRRPGECSRRGRRHQAVCRAELCARHPRACDQRRQVRRAFDAEAASSTCPGRWTTRMLVLRWVESGAPDVTQRRKSWASAARSSRPRSRGSSAARSRSEWSVRRAARHRHACRASISLRRRRRHGASDRHELTSLPCRQVVRIPRPAHPAGRGRAAGRDDDVADDRRPWRRGASARSVRSARRSPPTLKDSTRRCSTSMSAVELVYPLAERLARARNADGLPDRL